MSLDLPVPLSFAPMEAEQVAELPSGDDISYEPKWDGFRCLAFRDGDTIELMSKSGKPLARYFPDVVAALRELKPKRFVLDGEIVIRDGERLSFEQLLLRIHPAKSRVDKLAAATPAMLIVFDMLLDERGDSLASLSLRERRTRLEKFARDNFTERVRLSPRTADINQAREWLSGGDDGLDGVIAKIGSETYRTGERAGMMKVKRMRTADCVVGGFRYASAGKVLGSLLLGLHDSDGLLHHVGYTSSFNAAQKAALTPELEKIAGGSGFSGRAPGGPSRWSTRKSDDWVPLEPRLVAEVRYDHFSEGRFRHGTGFLRWRPDKDPSQCTLDQIATGGRTSLMLLEQSSS